MTVDVSEVLSAFTKRDLKLTRSQETVSDIVL